MMFFFFYKR